MAETNDKQAIAAEAQTAAGAASQAPLHIGIDVGSTTVKLAVLDDNNEILYSVLSPPPRRRARHHRGGAGARRPQPYSGNEPMTIAITGSGGLLLAQWLGIDFVQEVIASKTAVETFIPQTDVAIELGGEDAKIIYFDNGIEQRMNGTCAGGTGAFIDQMAALLDTDAGGLNELARRHDHHLPHREPLRRVRQDRRAAASERGRAQGGHRRLHLPVGGDADHLRPRVRPPHPRQRRLPRRPFAVPAPNCASASTKRWIWTTSSHHRARRTPTCSWPRLRHRWCGKRTARARAACRRA